MAAQDIPREMGKGNARNPTLEKVGVYLTEKKEAARHFSALKIMREGKKRQSRKGVSLTTQHTTGNIYERVRRHAKKGTAKGKEGKGGFDAPVILLGDCSCHKVSRSLFWYSKVTERLGSTG